jgi:hypothetical protein
VLAPEPAFQMDHPQQVLVRVLALERVPEQVSPRDRPPQGRVTARVQVPASVPACQTDPPQPEPVLARVSEQAQVLGLEQASAPERAFQTGPPRPVREQARASERESVRASPPEARVWELVQASQTDLPPLGRV